MEFEKGLSSYLTNDKYFGNKEVFLYVLRKDGVVVAKKAISRSENYLDDQSIGALSSGVWQAAQALTGLVDSNNIDDEVYRFSFDTSSSGVYLLPIEEHHILGCLFSDSLNPGLLKNELRKLKIYLINYKKIQKEKIGSAVSVAKKPLFDNITDEEMDNLFSFSGK